MRLESEQRFALTIWHLEDVPLARYFGLDEDALDEVGVMLGDGSVLTGDALIEATVHAWVAEDRLRFSTADSARQALEVYPADEAHLYAIDYLGPVRPVRLGHRLGNLWHDGPPLGYGDPTAN